MYVSFLVQAVNVKQTQNNEGFGMRTVASELSLVIKAVVKNNFL